MRILGAIAGILLAGTAYGADLATKAAPIAPTPYVASEFNGLYVGGNVGYGWSTFSISESDPFGSAKGSQPANGLLGGVQIGYNKTLGGMWVLGLETDYQLTGLRGTTNGLETSLPWFGTTRVRAGFLLTPSFMFYGTGGVAYGNAKVSDASPFAINIPGVGWAAGAGAEYALGKGWSLGAEYLHVSLKGPSANIGNVNLTTSADADIARAKVNYRF